MSNTIAGVPQPDPSTTQAAATPTKSAVTVPAPLNATLPASEPAAAHSILSEIEAAIAEGKHKEAGFVEWIKAEFAAIRKRLGVA